ncbi:unnamed protein product, partial [Prorocentrum cordatum]
GRGGVLVRRGRRRGQPGRALRQEADLRERVHRESARGRRAARAGIAGQPGVGRPAGRGPERGCVRQGAARARASFAGRAPRDAPARAELHVVEPRLELAGRAQGRRPLRRARPRQQRRLVELAGLGRAQPVRGQRRLVGLAGIRLASALDGRRPRGIGAVPGPAGHHRRSPRRRRAAVAVRGGGGGGGAGRQPLRRQHRQLGLGGLAPALALAVQRRPGPALGHAPQRPGGDGRPGSLEPGVRQGARQGPPRQASSGAQAAREGVAGEPGVGRPARRGRRPAAGPLRGPGAWPGLPLPSRAAPAGTAGRVRAAGAGWSSAAIARDAPARAELCVLEPGLELAGLAQGWCPRRRPRARHQRCLVELAGLGCPQPVRGQHGFLEFTSLQLASALDGPRPCRARTVEPEGHRSGRPPVLGGGGGGPRRGAVGDQHRQLGFRRVPQGLVLFARGPAGR